MSEAGSRPRGRLRRADCSGPGIGRRRRGSGFSYLDPEGGAVRDEETLARIRELAIPPAWREVWICGDPLGHVQATGVDEVRLLDLGFFRIGGESYAEENESYGVATILRQHVSIADGEVVFDFPAKSGQRRVQSVRDSAVKAAIETMRRRRGGPQDLLVYREDGGWRDVRSEDVNAYLQEQAGEEFSAKDFRTWHGTVLAAVELAREEPPSTKGGGERAIRAAIGRVAERLGNTPAVCRRSYVDPRVIDRFRDGKTIELPGRVSRGPVTPRRQGTIERRVLALIG